MSHTITQSRAINFSVTTSIEGDSIICHKTYRHKNGISKRIADEILNAKDKHVINAMIAMGWTHPDLEDEL